MQKNFRFLKMHRGLPPGNEEFWHRGFNPHLDGFDAFFRICVFVFFLWKFWFLIERIEHEEPKKQTCRSCFWARIELIQHVFESFHFFSIASVMTISKRKICVQQTNILRHYKPNNSKIVLKWFSLSENSSCLIRISNKAKTYPSKKKPKETFCNLPELYTQRDVAAIYVVKKAQQSSCKTETQMSSNRVVGILYLCMSSHQNRDGIWVWFQKPATT